MKKRIISILLVLAMLLSVAPAAFAEEAPTSGTCGENLNWAFDEATGTLTISGTGDMEDYAWSTVPWYSHSGNIKKLVIENGVTSIGNFVCMEFPNLASVVIPDSVTRIGNSAFANCDRLTSVTIPNSVTSIGGDAFSGCDNLTSVTIPNSVTSIEYRAFASCENLTSVVIPDSVTSIGAYAFYYCESLTSVTIPKSLTDIGGSAFAWTPFQVYGADENGFSIINDILVGYYGDGGDVVIPDGVIRIGNSAFAWCYSLTGVTLPDSVTGIDDMAFYECYNLSSVTIPNGVTSIGVSSFSLCTDLASVVIPESVTSIGDGAFSDCDSLVSVTIPESLTDIGDYAFDETPFLESVADEAGFAVINGIVFDYFGPDAGNIVIPDGTTRIAGSALSYCIGLTGIAIPDSVTSIGSAAFADCDSLTSLTIPDSVTSIGNYAFVGCDALTSIVLPDSVTSIGDGVFSSCKSLTSVEIPSGVTNIGSSAFLSCTALKSVAIPEGVKEINWFAFSNTGLETVQIPNSVTSIAYFAFAGCENLTSVTLPRQLKTIENNTFSECTSLEEVKFQSDAPEIGENCFYDVTAKVYYPEGNATWTEDVMQQYGGTITWVPYTPTYDLLFNDVSQDKWFFNAVLWAVDSGITTGTTETTFSPDDTCTRNQVVTFLWRAAGKPEPASTNNPFKDVKESDYFYKAVLWAVEKGVTTGTSATTFAPEEPCTRGQVVTFLHRAAGNPAASNEKNPFSDVGDAYYTEPVLWAVGDGITTGVTNTTFEPESTCTRAQIVTFLNRAY